MLPDSSLRVVVVPEPAQPVDALLASLTVAEQEQAKAHRTARRRRHFVLGRLAARVAVWRSLGTMARYSFIEILTGQDGEPIVQVDGATDVVSVSLSHSGCLAAACAWLSTSGGSAGVDLERIRLTEMTQSEYAFSRRERALFPHVPESRILAGLAAWTVKEAVWKALWPEQCANPAEVEIRALNLVTGYAAVEVDDTFLTRFGGAMIRARVGTIDGPDGHYLLSIAAIASRESWPAEITGAVRAEPKQETIRLSLGGIPRVTQTWGSKFAICRIW